MRLLITGSRGWYDEAKIEAVVKDFMSWAETKGEEFVLIHGHCPKGADALADMVGRRLGLVVGETLIRVPADWKKHGKGAGPKRNQQMLDEYHPTEVVAFRATGKSSGTDDMIAKAERAGVRTQVVFAPAFDA